MPIKKLCMYVIKKSSLKIENGIGVNYDFLHLKDTIRYSVIEKIISIQRVCLNEEMFGCCFIPQPPHVKIYV